MRGRRGLTLAEILVVAVLMLVILTVLVSLLVTTLRTYGRSTRSITLQQSALVAIGRLRDAVRNAHPDYVTAGPSALTVLDGQPLTSDSQGNLLWGRWSLYYLTARELRCHRRTFAPTRTPPPAPLTSPAPERDSLVAAQVEVFTVAVEAETGLVRLVLELRDGPLTSRIESGVLPLQAELSR